MKRVAGLLAVSMALAMLGGAAFASGGKEADSAAAKAEAKKVELVFYSYEKNFEATHAKIVEGFQAANPGVTVKIEYFPDIDTFYQKSDMMTLSGGALDVTEITWKAGYEKKATDGLFYPLTEFVRKEGIKLTDEYVIDTSFKGEVYGLPCDVKSWVIYLNKDMLDAAGLPVPPLDWTWEEYRQYAKKLTKGEGTAKTYGSFLENRWDRYFNFQLYNAKMDNPFFTDGKFDVSSPYFRSFLQFRWDMEQVDKTQIPTKEVVAMKLLAPDVFYNGKAAMAPFMTTILADAKNTQKYPHTFKTALAALPRADRSAPAGRTFSENRYWCVAKSSKNGWEAYKFVRYYTTQGMNLKSAGFSAAKKGDRAAVLKLMTGGNASGLYDMASVEATVLNPKWQDNAHLFTPLSTPELETLRIETSNAFLVGGITLDQALEKLRVEGQKIVDRYKN